MATATLPHVPSTPMMTLLYRGKPIKIEDPQVGSVLSLIDTGYGSGEQQSYIVVSVEKYKSGVNQGKPSKTIVSRIVKVENGIVTYDPNTQLRLKPYFSLGIWHYTATPRLNMFHFDKIVEPSVGYVK